eukprot:Lankesteria_metandrocarpae@DN5167_c0_g1_i3.p1
MSGDSLEQKPKDLTGLDRKDSVGNPKSVSSIDSRGSDDVVASSAVPKKMPLLVKKKLPPVKKMIGTAMIAGGGSFDGMSGDSFEQKPKDFTGLDRKDSVGSPKSVSSIDSRGSDDVVASSAVPKKMPLPVKKKLPPVKKMIGTAMIAGGGSFDGMSGDSFEHKPKDLTGLDRKDSVGSPKPVSSIDSRDSDDVVASSSVPKKMPLPVKKKMPPVKKMIGTAMIAGGGSFDGMSGDSFEQKPKDLTGLDRKDSVGSPKSTVSSESRYSDAPTKSLTTKKEPPSMAMNNGGIVVGGLMGGNPESLKDSESSETTNETAGTVQTVNLESRASVLSESDDPLAPLPRTAGSMSRVKLTMLQEDDESSSSSESTPSHTVRSIASLKKPRSAVEFPTVMGRGGHHAVSMLDRPRRAPMGFTAPISARGSDIDAPSAAGQLLHVRPKIFEMALMTRSITRQQVPRPSGISEKHSMHHNTPSPRAGGQFYERSGSFNAQVDKKREVDALVAVSTFGMKELEPPNLAKSVVNTAVSFKADGDIVESETADPNTDPNLAEDDDEPEEPSWFGGWF